MPDYGEDISEPATTLNLTAVVTPDDDWFMARCVEVPVVSQGPTVDEALANLTEALELYFEDEPARRRPSSGRSTFESRRDPGILSSILQQAGVSVDDLSLRAAPQVAGSLTRWAT
jgi:predicted RNase H-like HicB family nuclease